MVNTAMKILGLDLSITSPGFCVMTCSDSYEITGISLHGFTKTDKWVVKKEDLEIHRLPRDYNDHPPHYRAHLILGIVGEFINFDEIDYVAVEDYAFGGKGKIFDIAECSGALKNYFYEKNIPMKKFPPMTVKQCVTGTGGADKVMMGMTFKKSPLAKMVNSHIFELPEYDNPQEDLIDAIYMANVLRAELHYKEYETFPQNLYMPIESCYEAIVRGKKGAKTRPSIEHPVIEFGKFERVKKKKVEKKEKAPKEPKVAKVRAPKKKLLDK